MRGQITSLPGALYRYVAHAATHWRSLVLSDLVWELTDLLPSGLYNAAALERYVRSVLDTTGRTNCFEELRQELYIIATSLDTGDRVVFGPESGLPISAAVAASSAVPGLYRPVRMGEHEYIDGGLHGAASLDIAIEAGANLVVCINPMVPIDLRVLDQDRPHGRTQSFRTVANQTIRTLMHASVRYHVKHMRSQYPDVDILMIQPQRHDHRMFSYLPMHYRSRMDVAQHGFETVARTVLANLPAYRQILSRYQIALTPDRVLAELQGLDAHDRALDAVCPRPLRSVPQPTAAGTAG